MRPPLSLADKFKEGGKLGERASHEAEGEAMEIQHEFRQLMSYVCRELTRKVYGERRR